ncbi:MAG: DUF2806 domain-containing protein [Candidatus Omnitrophica bacterium]|nr:DUF2806 domain-containing protein [Candidatus Omnitrophota bacterium]MBU4477471.1 DUF2806 domain-containing protein [Candidatus Omnitrophota bacterium]MCG2704274.1 DUF2806 domain-containing protein [Candidatus Omnitrophota bacterium]
MGENSLINLGDLSKPATVLIEKISAAVGGIFKPYQIERVAKAEAKAEIIKAQTQIEVTDLHRRAISRFIAEEAQKQNNIENITVKAIPQLKDSANPNNIEDDWITNFFDKCRIISDEEMQSLWAKVLSGEANNPGTYSRRTVNFLGSLDKVDASLFIALCGFGWQIGDVVPLIYDAQAQIYNDKGINFNTVTHLDDIGLISFNSLVGFQRIKYPKKIKIYYYRTPLNIEFKNENDNSLNIGQVLLTKTGQQLAPICGSKPVDGFRDYVIEKLKKEGLIIS